MSKFQTYVKEHPLGTSYIELNILLVSYFYVFLVYLLGMCCFLLVLRKKEFHGSREWKHRITCCVQALLK